jgi:hypothetical protein
LRIREPEHPCPAAAHRLEDFLAELAQPAEPDLARSADLLPSALARGDPKAGPVVAIVDLIIGRIGDQDDARRTRRCLGTGQESASASSCGGCTAGPGPHSPPNGFCEPVPRYSGRAGWPGEFWQ